MFCYPQSHICLRWRKLIIPVYGIRLENNIEIQFQHVRYLKMCLSVCLFVNSLNVKGQCKYFINTIFNHNLVQNASFIFFFFIKVTTAYTCFRSSFKSSCDLSQGQRSRSNRHTPQITKNAYFMYMFISKSIVCACLKLNL